MNELNQGFQGVRVSAGRENSDSGDVIGVWLHILTNELRPYLNPE